MTRIGIILGSTRPNRNSESVGRWVLEHTAGHDASFEIIDLREHTLPLFDEPLPPMAGQYQNPHTRAWAELISSFDGFVVVTPEYNHAPSAVLKNALDYLYAEWNNKAVGFVSYGMLGGVRATEQLRLVAGELQMADVRAQVALSMVSDFENFSEFRPAARHEGDLQALLGQVVSWSRALAPLRQAGPVAATV
ncbi:FMN reductase [Kineosporia sp. NBRC 101677]|uniref:NADPH-dependent FMN reductase n=1 Tax=Kineosporia sp. NBRC 101677 TaxID=3032197 RepID=UPI0024A0A86F|nr:NAD(P)H-dependent oxidoreductase [Kineosporia sp. NBRC 101677]GLY18874.1 FMN reductase [Kineosporia sp. NBRC 101677]